jgi:hypothetical protein
MAAFAALVRFVCLSQWHNRLDGDAHAPCVDQTTDFDKLYPVGMHKPVALKSHTSPCGAFGGVLTSN